jgi:hypothetical protein
LPIELDGRTRADAPHAASCGIEPDLRSGAHITVLTCAVVRLGRTRFSGRVGAGETGCVRSWIVDTLCYQAYALAGEDVAS